MRTKIRARHELWSDLIDLAIFQEDGQKRYAVTKLALEEIDTRGVASPTLSLAVEEAEGLMDELWACGIRPHNGEGGAAQVDAMKNHLKDLQRIIFNEK